MNRPVTVPPCSTSFADKRILITRPRPAAQKLAAKLELFGVVPIVCPLLRVVIPRENTALDAAVRGLPEYNWLAFTSANGVKAFWRRLDACGFDARRLFGCKLAALGFATARQLRCCGWSADVSARSAGELAAAMISKSEGSSGRVLWPRGDRAMTVLRNRLCDAGYTVNDPVAYRTLSEKPLPAVLNDIRRGVDAVLIYSPSAANQLASLDLSLSDAIIVCIGQATATAAKAVGLHVDAIAEQPSDDGVLAELARCFSSKVTL
jgi:uroporphyrinogen III methyltransferase/synthase